MVQVVWAAPERWADVRVQGIELKQVMSRTWPFLEVSHVPSGMALSLKSSPVVPSPPRTAWPPASSGPAARQGLPMNR